RRGILDPGERPGRLDTRHLHAEADSEIGNPAFTREPGGKDLAFRTAFAEAARHENAMDLLEKRRRILAFEDFRLDPFEPHAYAIGHAAMIERLDQRLVGVLEAGILADNGDG